MDDRLARAGGRPLKLLADISELIIMMPFHGRLSRKTSKVPAADNFSRETYRS